ncbi:AEC family transporter [Acinetobacter towneri]|uniref:AEC family transporter n=1 Tax=Acinetobacter towneri TaxID=202956 RepID=UPI002097C01D|nr:AEC family transporter [Acinetobacter towneri]MCO8048129.1 AEC family transporter [Acinetobacter towneri]
MTHLIFIALFPLIALIAMGYLLKQSRMLDEPFWKGAEKLNYYILFPSMLFLNLATANIEAKSIAQILSVVGIVVALVGCLLYAFRGYFKTPAVRFGVYMQSMVRFNTYIGLALVAALFQVQGMALFAIILVFCIPLVNVLSVLALSDTKTLQAKQILWSLMKNPLILGCIVGGLFNLSGLSLWEGAAHFIRQIALCSLPLGLMCVGAALQFNGLQRDVFALALNVFGRLLFMPALAWIICQSLNVPVLESQILVLFFALPTASAAYVLTQVLGGDSRLMASIISLQTVFAALTLPIVLWLLI